MVAANLVGLQFPKILIGKHIRNPTRLTYSQPRYGKNMMT